MARRGVDLVVVGGIGGILHGSPITTKDVDVVPDLKATNLDALADALDEMNARVVAHDAPDGLIEIDWRGKDLRRWIVDFRFLILMTDYGRVDLIHRPAGTSGYSDLARNAIDVKLDEVHVRVAALEDIIRSKEAAGRERDLAQLPTLRRLLEAKQQRRA
ncbi:MAG TPA: hypothetical protein VHJ76_02265 [Actinomycetota bacterium]|nr:hypothetical protein [Actinomycetota bacterium]